MGRFESKERSDHQCRSGSLQSVSSAATRWGTHYHGVASERFGQKVGPSRTLWLDGSHWTANCVAPMGFATWSKPWICVAPYLSRNVRRNPNHSPVDGQYLDFAAKQGK